MATGREQTRTLPGTIESFTTMGAPLPAIAVLGAAALALALIGAGRFSLDRALLRGRVPAWLS